MTRNNRAQHYELVNSFVSRLADNLEAKTEGENAPDPRVWRGTLTDIYSGYFVPALSWTRSC